MTRISLIILFSLLLTGISVAQEKKHLINQEKKHFIGLVAGASFPVGTYGERELTPTCFTLPGFNISYECFVLFVFQLSLGGHLGYNVHPIDVGSLGAEKVKNDPFLSDLTIRSDPFRLVSGNIGFYYDHPLSPKFDLSGKLLGGMMYGITPYQLYKPEYFMVEPKWYEITSSRDWGYTFMAGAQLKYHFNPYVGVYFDTYYSYSRLDFDFRIANGNIRTELKHVMFIVTAIGVSISL